MVWMTPKNMVEYPHLSDWLVRDLNKVRHQPNIFKNFVKYSETGYLKKSASLILMLGFPPEIDVLDCGYNKNGKIYGRFDRELPNKICLDYLVADRFEIDYQLDKARHCVQALVLHELVHWGDARDGIIQSGEAGKKFEKDAYGYYNSKWW